VLGLGVVHQEIHLVTAQGRAAALGRTALPGLRGRGPTRTALALLLDEGVDVRDDVLEHLWRVFQERLGHWGPLAAGRLGTPPAPRLRLRRMRRRWGSCTGQGVVTLNTRLVERCRCLIDYVLVHELCHLRELNHSPRFHALVADLMPDWRARSEALDRGALTLSPTCVEAACSARARGD